MKHYILLSVALLFAANLFAQTWTKHPVSATLPTDSKILQVDPTGKVWVGGAGIWLSVWDGKQWTSETRPANLPITDKDLFVTAMSAEVNNRQVLGTNKGIIHNNPRGPENQGQLIVNVASNQESLFLLDQKGINVAQSNKFNYNMLLPQSCSSEANSQRPVPSRILWDKQRKQLWTNTIALSTVNDRWTCFKNTENARDITLTPDGRLAFVSQSGQLCFFNKNNDSLYTYTVRFKSKTPLTLQSATAAPDGSWWFTTNDPEVRFFTVDKLTGKTLKLESATTLASCDCGATVLDKVYDTFDIQKLPSYPGGEIALQKYLRDSMIYPEMARQNNIQGTISLSFVVRKDGSVSDIKTLQNPGSGLAEEAIRLVKNMPKWTPGQANGNNVSVKFTLPIRFRLQ